VDPSRRLSSGQRSRLHPLLSAACFGEHRRLAALHLHAGERERQPAERDGAAEQLQRRERLAGDGYYYDFVRSTVVGREPSPAQLELLDHVAAGDDGEVDLSSDLLESIGHGIGVGWDEPVLTPKTETVLEAGMTLAVEQHVSRRGVGTVRYEETLIVTGGEPELMTSGCRARWW
jgi:hypothetical protein